MLLTNLKVSVKRIKWALQVVLLKSEKMNCYKQPCRMISIFVLYAHTALPKPKAKLGGKKGRKEKV